MVDISHTVHRKNCQTEWLQLGIKEDSEKYTFEIDSTQIIQMTTCLDVIQVTIKSHWRSLSIWNEDDNRVGRKCRAAKLKKKKFCLLC